MLYKHAHKADVKKAIPLRSIKETILVCRMGRNMWPQLMAVIFELNKQSDLLRSNIKTSEGGRCAG
jgi:hypothetical protein